MFDTEQETQMVGNKLKPILICIFDGSKYFNFYISDFNNVESMVITALKTLLSWKYRGYKVYIHNFSNFDGIFLLKYLVNLKNNNDKPVIIKPTLKDGKLINIDVIFDKFDNKDPNTISFRDTYLILLASLAKLGKSFQVGSKGIFHFKKVDNLSKEELKLHKEEIISYCKQDCNILYLVIQKFNKLIYDMWGLNINNYPTLPSIAFALFRSKFLNKEEVPNIIGQMYLDIKESYTGCSVSNKEVWI